MAAPSSEHLLTTSSTVVLIVVYHTNAYCHWGWHRSRPTMIVPSVGRLLLLVTSQLQGVKQVAPHDEKPSKEYAPYVAPKLFLSIRVLDDMCGLLFWVSD
eukprot:2558032-Amphidinium_carterae.1